MKIFISADIEGTAGIAAWPETELSAADSAYFRRQMSREVAAACRGALEAGVDEILVKDAHDSARNIDPAELPEQASILRGWARNPYVMMAGLDESFAGAFYTGYHSGAGSDGNPLSHTMNLQNNYVLINGVKASELYLNMLSASYLGVPSLLVPATRRCARGPSRSIRAWRPWRSAGDWAAPARRSTPHWLSAAYRRPQSARSIRT